MKNWQLRLGRALTAVGALIQAQPSTGSWGLYMIAAGSFFGILFPETDGGKLATYTLPPTK